MVEKLYNEHFELIDDNKNTFFGALGDLTLEAWEAQVNNDHLGFWDTGSASDFIELLWNKGRNEDLGIFQMPTAPDSHGHASLALTDNNDLDGSLGTKS